MMTQILVKKRVKQNGLRHPAASRLNTYHYYAHTKYIYTYPPYAYFARFTCPNTATPAAFY